MTWDNRVSRADLLIWIDRSSALRFWRVLCRTWHHRGNSRVDLPEDCPELLGNLPEFFQVHVVNASFGTGQNERTYRESARGMPGCSSEIKPRDQTVFGVCLEGFQSGAASAERGLIP